MWSSIEISQHLVQITQEIFSGELWVFFISQNINCCVEFLHLFIAIYHILADLF